MTGNSPSLAMDSASGAGIEASLTANSRKAQIAHFLQRDGIGAFLVLVVLSVIAAGSIDKFATRGNFGNLLSTTAMPAIIAIGMTMVIIKGGIDLSVGSVFALSSVLMAKAIDPSKGMGLNMWAGFALAMGAALAIGFFQGNLIARTGMPPFIVTLAGLYAVRGMVIQVSKGGNETYSVPGQGVFYSFGKPFASGLLHGLSYPIFVAGAMFLIWHVVLTRTAFGLTTFAIGGSEHSATLMGLKVRETKVKLYVVSAGLAGLAGVLQTAYSQSGLPTAGQTYELQAIAAVVIGGTLLTGGAGSLIGTAAGVMLLAIVQNVINLGTNLDNAVQQVVTGVFVVAVVIAQRFLNRVQRR